MKGFVVAGTASGVGKTTLTLGLIAALRRRGLTVQPFKVGPDYIDPSYHAVAAGRPCRNLDSWMLPEAAVRTLFARATQDADVAVVEGVMGLFDGRSSEGDVGSTAHVARLLSLPVVLVLDAARTARSAAATALGFARFETRVNVVGCLLNNVASERHRQLVAEAVEGEAGLPVLGALGRAPEFRLEERYLGLVPTAERGLPDGLLDRLTGAVEQSIDLDRLLSLAAITSVTDDADGADGLFPSAPVSTRVRIGVARDAAFTFYYADNLDLLRAWGAELVEFSPLDDRTLPTDVGALYFGGGFPELFADRLAANSSLLADVRRAAVAGMPIVAECGGLMYLGEALTGREGRRRRMVGVLPTQSSLERGRLTLGYREVAALRDSPLLHVGESVRGHEFHWSVSPAPPASSAAYRLDGADERLEGFASDSLVASYVHLHFGADARLAPRFVDVAAAWARAGGTAPGPSGAFGAAPVPRSAPPTSAPSAGRLLRQHGFPPRETEQLSTRRILERFGDRLPAAEPERSLVGRLVYTAGDADLIPNVRWADGAIEAAVEALRRGCPLVVDVRMVAAGLDRRTLSRLGLEPKIAIDAPEAAALAAREGITRSAAGILALGAQLDGAVVAIGNAPTALLALLDLAESGIARPAAILGFPVGFVAAAESKDELARSDLPYLTILGTRGGSPFATAAVNYLARLAAPPTDESREADSRHNPAHERHADHAAV